MVYIIKCIIKCCILYYVMHFQIHVMEPEPYWKLAILDTSYTWLSAELLNYAHVNLPLEILGIPFVCLFVCLISFDHCM